MSQNIHNSIHLTPIKDVQKQPPPLPVVDEKTIRARAAAARAYALSATPEQPFASHLAPSAAATSSRLQQQQQLPPPHFVPHIQDEDYAQFVKCLVDDDFFRSLPDEDDMDFQFLDTDEEDDDDEDDDDDDEEEESPVKQSSTASTPQTVDEDDDDEPFTIETELGLLMEEDLEAAVTTLLGQPHPATPDPKTLSDHPATSASTRPSAQPRNQKVGKCIPTATSNATNQKTATVHNKPIVTHDQVSRLRLLLKRHYQLLLQQAVLCVRAAGGTTMYETSDDLTEILDGAVGMLQDLDQCRKDAIRTSIQLQPAKTDYGQLMPTDTQPATTTMIQGEGRLTRAAFSKTLMKDGSIRNKTLFDIPGLNRLKETFHTMDDSKTIVKRPTAQEACRMVLQSSEDDWDPQWLPGVREYSSLLSSPKEIFGHDFEPPCTPKQVEQLKRDRNQFTAAEDSLVFRGVNLYGEKQWLLIADRYLPDRSVNIISQRYSKLSLLMYRAHGIHIHENGDLVVPPKLESVDKESEAKLACLRKVDPPAILNVHRWSIEEDLTLLRAVPIIGHMWAELSTRLIPHRDRGHLRKRYQVLERRVKATVARAKKEGGKQLRMPTTTTVASPPQFLKKRSNSQHASPSPIAMRQSPTIKRMPYPSTSSRSPNHYGRPPFPNTSSDFHSTDNHNSSAIPNQFDNLERDQNGFESMLNETTNENFDEWSQMSRMKKVMEEQSLPDTGGVSRLASAVAAAMEMERLANSDSKLSTTSGLDMLASVNIMSSSAINDDDDDNQHTRTPTKQHRQPRASIMDSVLERTGAPATTKQVPGTPKSSPMPRNAGYSPALAASSPPLKASPGTFGGTSRLWGHTSNMSHIPNYDERHDDGVVYDFDMSQTGCVTSTPSKQLFDLATGLTTASQMSSSFPMEQHQPQQPISELDAISALNSLSNSPARFAVPFKPGGVQPRYTKEDEGDAATTNHGNKSMGSVKRSLFDKAVKRVDSRKKRKV